MSAGGFIAAGLANGMTPRQLCAAFIENDGATAATCSARRCSCARPGASTLRRLAALPGLAAQAALHFAFKRRSLLAALERLGRALPTGLFSGARDGAPAAHACSRAPGRSNDFRQLQRQLVLVATDLDSGDAVPFGQPGRDDVPISLAVQASAALPGPVRAGADRRAAPASTAR